MPADPSADRTGLVRQLAGGASVCPAASIGVVRVLPPATAGVRCAVAGPLKDPPGSKPGPGASAATTTALSPRQRPSVRRGTSAVPDGRGGLDGAGRDQRQHGLGAAERDWAGREPFSHGEAVHELAGVESAAPRVGGQDSPPPGASRVQSGGPCLTLSGAGLLSRQARLGSLLPAR